jgi:hypothetical protein
MVGRLLNSLNRVRRQSGQSTFTMMDMNSMSATAYPQNGHCHTLFLASVLLAVLVALMAGFPVVRESR